MTDRDTLSSSSSSRSPLLPRLSYQVRSSATNNGACLTIPFPDTYIRFPYFRAIYLIFLPVVSFLELSRTDLRIPGFLKTKIYTLKKLRLKKRKIPGLGGRITL